MQAITVSEYGAAPALSTLPGPTVGAHSGAFK